MLLNCGAGEDIWSPLACKEIQPVHPKGDQSWTFSGRTDVEAKAPVLWPRDVKSWLIGKDPDAGKDWGQEEKKAAEEEMVGWHHQLNRHEFKQTPGDSEGQGSLAMRSWRVGHSLVTEQQQRPTGLPTPKPPVHRHPQKPQHLSLLVRSAFTSAAAWSLARWGQLPPWRPLSASEVSPASEGGPAALRPKCSVEGHADAPDGPAVASGQFMKGAGKGRGGGDRGQLCGGSEWVTALGWPPAGKWGGCEENTKFPLAGAHSSWKQPPRP